MAEIQIENLASWSEESLEQRGKDVSENKI
jgi:hypothetical protein